MRIHQLSEIEALSSLGTSADGLSSAEARRRLDEFGPNHVEELRREHPLLRLLREFVHFFAVILWVAAGLAFFADWSAPGEGMAKLGWAIVVVILVSGVFSFWQEYRAERTLALLRKLLPPQIATVREGKVVELPSEDLVPGDVVLLEQGDRVPADCRLIEAFGTACFSAIIAMQIVNVFLCRSPDRSLWFTGLLGNPLILWGALLEVALVLSIDYTALGNAVFGTAPIGADGCGSSSRRSPRRCSSWKSSASGACARASFGPPGELHHREPLRRRRDARRSVRRGP